MGSSPHDRGVVDRDGCLQLLATVPVGRVALSVDALPVITAVGFVVDGDRVVFAVAPEARATAALHGMVVAFEADHWDATTGTGWSVLVQGPAKVVADPAERERLIVPTVDHAVAGSYELVAVATAVITGRRLGAGVLAVR
jgi:nitroimidazol reductase NimA-like FMN-containing flavoprotein (pyridoxamine 5'-phosphate oxidase superfamily)